MKGSQDLVGKIESIKRSANMRQVLADLANADPMYAFNVPPRMVMAYSDKQLKSYLDEVYSQEFFVFEDPNDIAKYAKPNDRVIKKGVKELFETVLAHDQEGKVTERNTDSQKKVSVNFGNKTYLIPRDNLRIPIKKGFINTKVIERKPIHQTNALNRGVVVSYAGKEIRKTTLYVPHKSEGIIMHISTNTKTNSPLIGSMFIAWLDTENVIQHINETTHRSDYGPIFSGIVHSYWFKPNELKLIVKNKVPYQQIYSTQFEDGV